MTSIPYSRRPAGASVDSGRPHSVALFINGSRGLNIARRLAEANHRVTGLFVHGSALANTEPLLNLFPVAAVHPVDGSNWDTVGNALRESKTQVGIAAGFSLLLPPSVTRIPPQGFLNLHAGPVPRYRGGSPLNWQLIEGESRLGISILRMTEGIDDGPIVGARDFVMPTDGTISDAHAIANALFGDLLLDILENLPQSIKEAQVQSASSPTYWHQRSDRDGQINVWSHSAEEVCRLVRALAHPYPGAWFNRSGDKFRVYAAEVSSRQFRGSPGRIVKIGEFEPVLIVRGGSIRLTEVSCESGVRPLRNGDYVDVVQTP